MDNGSLGLVVGLIDDRISAIRRARPKAEQALTHALVQLVDSLLEGVQRERGRLLDEIKAAGDAERVILGRKLLRLLSQLRGFSMLTPYLSDVGRSDIAMGLVQAVDMLIGALLPKGADPVVHLDEHHNYSTLDLVALTEPIRTSLSIGDAPSPGPVVFFVPSTDPTNALLLPILAHEVGHSAVDEADLGSAVLSGADHQALDHLLDECLNAAGTSDPTAWKLLLFRWLDELLCDALAATLTGPSYLFASAVFLPAPEGGAVGSHPFPSDRVQMILRLLAHHNWRPLLEDHASQITAWLKGLDEPIDGSSPLERFLREGIRILEPAVVEVAEEYVSGALDPGEFDRIQSFLAQLLHVGIPPAEVGGDPTPPWAAVLSAWLHRIREHGDEPKSLVAATVDADYNASILKAVEMSRILEFWKNP